MKVALAVDRAGIIHAGDRLTRESTDCERTRVMERRSNATDRPASCSIDTSRKLSEIRRDALESVERKYLIQLLSEHNGIINTSAEAAGISTRQLRNLLQTYGIKKEEFKTR